jgi:L-asparaginase
MHAALDFGNVDGLVLASPNGGVGANEIIAQVAAAIPVVRHVRINVGMIAPSAGEAEEGSVISSGLINSQKSRIMLQLALATGADPRETFEEPLKSILYG